MKANIVNYIVCSIYLITAAYQDLKKKSIYIWTYFIAAMAAIFILLQRDDADIKNHLISMSLGIILLVISKLTNGAIGEGDGWFFVVSGIFLKWQENLMLLVGGIILCGLSSLCIAVWYFIHKKSAGKKVQPFIPYLIPAGIILLMNL